MQIPKQFVAGRLQQIESLPSCSYGVYNNHHKRHISASAKRYNSSEEPQTIGGAQFFGRDKSDDKIGGGNTLFKDIVVEAEAGKKKIRVPVYCPGCGIRMQNETDKKPGYFVVPKSLLKDDRPKAFDPDTMVLDPKNQTNEEMTAVLDAYDQMVNKWLGDESQNSAWMDVPFQSQITERTVDIICKRCNYIRTFNAIKDEDMERKLPQVTPETRISNAIRYQRLTRHVVVLVVDLFDFDGSLPRQALKSILPLEMTSSQLAERDFRLIVVASKVDLFPAYCSPIRLEEWVRRRCKQAGLPRPEAVQLVSNVKGFGVRDLMASLARHCGTSANLWIVGSQNAGKSSLLNRLKAECGTGEYKKLTQSWIPGTTLSTVRVMGLPLPRNVRVFDTPGVPHYYQMHQYLNLREKQLLYPQRPLKARTYRMMAGQSVLVGGILRLDCVSLQYGTTCFVNLWASDTIPTFYGKQTNIERNWDTNVGRGLYPPLGVDRKGQLPPLVPTDVWVQGNSFTTSQTDIHVAGLGWFGVGTRGRADFRVWAYEGVAITTHDSIIPDYAAAFERAGFGRDTVITKWIRANHIQTIAAKQDEQLTESDAAPRALLTAGGNDDVADESENGGDGEGGEVQLYGGIDESDVVDDVGSFDMDNADEEASADLLVKSELSDALSDPISDEADIDYGNIDFLENDPLGGSYESVLSQQQEAAKGLADGGVGVGLVRGGGVGGGEGRRRRQIIIKE